MDNITLTHDDDSIVLTHAVPSGKARVSVSKIIASVEIDPKTKRLTEIMLEKAASIDGNADKAEIIKSVVSAVEDGTLTINDIIEGAHESPEIVAQRTRQTYDLFRVACDQRQLTTEWKARIADDAFMDEQNITEVEAFVASFRELLGS